MSDRGTVRRIISLILVICLALGASISLSSCSALDSAKSYVEVIPGEIVSETDKDLTIIDQAGREVTVSKDIDSIAVCYRVVIRFLLSLDQGDKIKGIGKTEDFLEEVQPSLTDCADVGMGVADIEALAELGPDLFIHKASDEETLNAVQEIGIPSIGIEVETPEDMMVALDVLGKVCGAEEKAAELVSYYKEKIEYCESLSAQISDSDRVSAIVMGTSIGKVADGSMLQGEMLEKAGAVNCAKDLSATELWPTAGTEQIFEWNPDYIFITGSESARFSAEDIYEDKAWSELKAVKNRNIYMIPAEYDSWEFPGIVSVLGIEFMIRTMYPQLISEEELEADVAEFYKMSYGVEYSREKLGY